LSTIPEEDEDVGAMPPGPTLDVEEQKSPAEPATLLGGGSATAPPKKTRHIVWRDEVPEKPMDLCDDFIAMEQEVEMRVSMAAKQHMDWIREQMKHDAEAGKELADSIIRGAYEQLTIPDVLDCLLNAKRWLEKDLIKVLRKPKIALTPDLVVMKEARLIVHAKIVEIRLARWTALRSAQNFGRNLPPIRGAWV
jgi:hypothetical protein